MRLLKLTLEGYKDEERTVYLSEGDVKVISVEMQTEVPEQRKWKVDVSTIPSGAKILVNRSFTGKWTPDYIILYDGQYTIGVEKSGYLPAEADLYLGD